MMKFFRGLGKKVQGLLKNIFSKKEKPQNEVKWNCLTTCGSFTSLGPGEVYIDGESIGKIKEIISISKDDLPDEKWESLKSAFGLGYGDSDGEINRGWVELPPVMEPEKKIFNIPLSFLPKRYWCKTLLISMVANQANDYQAVDMSQYDEKKLAHLILGRTSSWEELIEEYLEDCEVEDYEEERAWVEETIERAKKHGLFSVPIGEATLLHYEELGVWDYEEIEAPEELG
jgi:hypothetical protein